MVSQYSFARSSNYSSSPKQPTNRQRYCEKRNREREQRRFRLFLFALFRSHLTFWAGGVEQLMWDLAASAAAFQSKTAADVIIIPKITISSDDFVIVARLLVCVCVFDSLLFLVFRCRRARNVFLLHFSFQPLSPFGVYDRTNKKRIKWCRKPRDTRNAAVEDDSNGAMTTNRLM